MLKAISTIRSVNPATATTTARQKRCVTLSTARIVLVANVSPASTVIPAILATSACPTALVRFSIRDTNTHCLYFSNHVHIFT